MPWQDRLRQAAYTPPSGKRLTFDYENVEETVEKKTAAFNFPGVDGTFIQDLGHKGRQRPLRVILWGDNHDLDANRFSDALLETGTGRLEHPLYGTLNVIPFGRIRRRDDLKDRANQTIFDVVFWETLDIVFPSATAEPSSGILDAISDFSNGLVDQFSNAISLNNASDTASFKSQFFAAIDATNDILGDVAATQADVEQTFSAVRDSLRGNLVNTILDLPSIAAQATRLVQIPSLAITDIFGRLGAYGDLLSGVITKSGIREPGLGVANQNDFLIDDIFVSSAVSGAITSSVNTTFNSKSEALQAADTILNMQDASTIWRDQNYQSLA